MTGSGLDTSGGTEFLQRRIGLFALIIAGIAIAFLLVGVILGLALGMPVGAHPTNRSTYANVAGMVLLLAIWLTCRRGRYSARVLNVLDAVAIVGSCFCWSLFIETQVAESVSSTVVSVLMTLLTRAIAVPSTATRTLRLSVLAVLPSVAMTGWWITELTRPGAPVPPVNPWITVVFQTLLLAAAVFMATITSRIIYDLRRSVREANELGQYTLEEKLGSGGMGEVWRARHRFLVRAAAIKLIRPEVLAPGPAEREVAMRRFEREALATAALRSPHTVQLYDFGQAEDGTLFYVMELLGGIDLEELVTRFGPMPPERAVHLLLQVCDSLAEAHRNGLTHRDIKPANIVVSEAGAELDFVKVLDFGLVRFQPEQPGGARAKLTAEGSFAGTPAFLAPEIAIGEAAYDHRVDLYAVGCVAYWLLTGELVFSATTVMKMIIDHAHAVPPRPHTRTEQPIPADLEQVIMECLAKDPADRPPGAAELAERLAACKLARPWTRDRAAAWWRAHVPERQAPRPVADVLLSREASPAGARALRPQRAPRI